MILNFTIDRYKEDLWDSYFYLDNYKSHFSIRSYSVFYILIKNNNFLYIQGIMAMVIIQQTKLVAYLVRIKTLAPITVTMVWIAIAPTWTAISNVCLLILLIVKWSYTDKVKWNIFHFRFFKDEFFQVWAFKCKSMF